MLLRSPLGLPDGMRRIAAVLDEVGPDVAALDVRAVVRLLGSGLEAARRHRVLEPGAAVCAADAVRALRQAATSSLATTAPPDPRLRMLTSEVYRQMNAGGAEALTGWLREATTVAGALTCAVESAGSAGRLLGRPGETSEERPGHAHRLWVQVPPAETSDHPAVLNLQAAATALERAESDLLSPAGYPDARQAATGSAVRAAAELRCALAGRRALTTVSQPLPSNPAQRQALDQHARGHLRPRA